MKVPDWFSEMWHNRKNYVEVFPVKWSMFPEKKKEQPDMITAAQLTYICPGKKGQIAINWAKAFSAICPLYGIGKNEFEEFIANILEESGELTRVEENLNYSVDGLLKTFSRVRISTVECYKYGRSTRQEANQKAIGNVIYGGDWGRKNLGNRLNTNDGYDLRGSSIIQITGGYMSIAFTRFYNKLTNNTYTYLQVVAMLRDIIQMDMQVHAACWVFAIEKDLLKAAAQDKLLITVLKINGGRNGLERREIYWKRAKEIL